MKVALHILALTMISAPAWAASEADDTPLICHFTTVCTDDQPCEAAPVDAAMPVLLGDGWAELTVEDETDRFALLSDPGADPQTFFSSGIKDGGGAMLSIYADGAARMTMHSNLFGPFTVTAMGTCGPDVAGAGDGTGQSVTTDGEAEKGE